MSRSPLLFWSWQLLEAWSRQSKKGRDGGPSRTPRRGAVDGVSAAATHLAGRWCRYWFALPQGSPNADLHVVSLSSGLHRTLLLLGPSPSNAASPEARFCLSRLMRPSSSCAAPRPALALLSGPSFCPGCPFTCPLLERRLPEAPLQGPSRSPQEGGPGQPLPNPFLDPSSI